MMQRLRIIACSIIALFCLCQSARAQGTVWAWGWNPYGELGNGTYTTSNKPAQVGGLTGVTAIAAVGLHSLALKSDGTVWAWGDNSSGELGNATYTNNDTPVQVLGPGGVGFLTGVTALGGGLYHSLALKSDGTVWAWGQNTVGQLGNGVFDSPFQIPPQNTPGQVLGPGGVGFLTGVTSITGGSSGASHSLALKSDGTVWGWGWNAYGQLGDGPSGDSNTPVQPSGLSGVTAISGGGVHSLALKSDDTVWAWGYNVYGQLGNGTLGLPLFVSDSRGVGFYLLLLAAVYIGFTVLRKTNVEMAVTNKRVLVKQGILRRRTLELLLDKVESIGVNEGILGRMLGYGTVFVRGTGGTPEPCRSIRQPKEFRRQVQQRIEEREQK